MLFTQKARVKLPFILVFHPVFTLLFAEGVPNPIRPFEPKNPPVPTVCPAIVAGFVPTGALA
jgi:hypothetical protein